jgi:hypothetical protein
MYLAAVVLFDAIPTGLVSKHNSVGLIPLQRRNTDAAQGFKIVFLGIIQSTALVFPRCNRYILGYSDAVIV